MSNQLSKNSIPIPQAYVVGVVHRSKRCWDLWFSFWNIAPACYPTWFSWWSNLFRPSICEWNIALDVAVGVSRRGFWYRQCTVENTTHFQIFSAYLIWKWFSQKNGKVTVQVRRGRRIRYIPQRHLGKSQRWFPWFCNLLCSISLHISIHISVWVIFNHIYIIHIHIHIYIYSLCTKREVCFSSYEVVESIDIHRPWQDPDLLLRLDKGGTGLSKPGGDIPHFEVYPDV